MSLGTTRTFDFRYSKTGQTHTLQLTHGSLLIMQRRTQLDWAHRVPKELEVHGERINLTFRYVDSSAAPKRP